MIQIGIRGSVVRRYVSEWINAVRDVTDLVHAVRDAFAAGTELPPVPDERAYPIEPRLRKALGMETENQG